MPTTTMQAAVHRLAVLIAAERETADAHRQAATHLVSVILGDGTESASYRAASDAEDQAARARVRAQAEVDDALTALSRQGVAA